ncbi:hypothetical protein MRBLMN1_001767 [Chitinophaga ginsengisegetis]|uniref:hypothetical protein n=1 Tax=Chitinophaga ginsengisegetis TaxID=393003 RepID=UPI000DB9235F|nr:hypothetical protein [Chitinophaga ginsengisegetis]MDR6571340.1 hypothetical protein [Chitinophaga ginsengisegetis]MDR6651074.1 hypothetical protein [Chitinophaga ginsengisegetis]MDR6657424.1 hypothetical protein [Chitinophaga ginsengisegetis]
MTEEQKKMILDFSDELISETQFLEQYPLRISDSKSYILNLLKSSFKNKDKDGVTYGLLLGFSLNHFQFDDDFVGILSELLAVDWHYCHEDIVSILQDINNPSSTKILYQTVLEKNHFLPYDDTYQLARRCIKALSAIGGDSAIEYLHILSQSPIKEVQAYAKKELERKGW